MELSIDFYIKKKFDKIKKEKDFKIYKERLTDFFESLKGDFINPLSAGTRKRIDLTCLIEQSGRFLHQD